MQTEFGAKATYVTARHRSSEIIYLPPPCARGKPHLSVHPYSHRRPDTMQSQEIDKTGATPNTIFLTPEITLGVVTGQFLTWEVMKSWVTIEPQRFSTQTAKPGAVSAWLTEHFLPKKEEQKAQWSHFPEGNTTKFNRSGHLKCTSAHPAHCSTWKQPRTLQLWRTDDCLTSALPSEIRKKIMQKILWNTKYSLSSSSRAVSSLLWQDKRNCSSHHNTLPACKIIHSPKGT